MNEPQTEPARNETTEVYGTGSSMNVHGTTGVLTGNRENTAGSGDTPVLLRTRPHILSFTDRYLLAFTPVVLVILSFFVKAAMEGLIQGFMPKLSGPLATMMPNITDLSEITVYLVAPVFLFVVVAAIGYDFRRTEAWVSILIAFVLSVVVAFLFTITSPVTTTSEALLFLQWTAFLAQPFSLVAAILVIAGVEKYRRSISYTIKETGVLITSGLMRRHEQMIPVQMIGRVDVSQGFLGKWSNYGTVVPHGALGPDFGPLIQGAGARNISGFTAPRPGPAECLYGIPDPYSAEHLLIRLIARTRKQ
jgi:membrane protein YdbS with pleckstrin-like domain